MRSPWRRGGRRRCRAALPEALCPGAGASSVRRTPQGAVPAATAAALGLWCGVAIWREGRLGPWGPGHGGAVAACLRGAGSGLTKLGAAGVGAQMCWGAVWVAQLCAVFATGHLPWAALGPGLGFNSQQCGCALLSGHGVCSCGGLTSTRVTEDDRCTHF